MSLCPIKSNECLHESSTTKLYPTFVCQCRSFQRKTQSIYNVSISSSIVLSAMYQHSSEKKERNVCKFLAKSNLPATAFDSCTPCSHPMRGWKMDASDRFVRASMNSVRGRTDGQWVTSCRMGPTKLNFILLPRLIRHSATLPLPFPIPFHRRSQRAGVCSWLTLIACCMMQNTVRKFSIDANVQSLTVNSFVRITQGTGGQMGIWVYGALALCVYECVCVCETELQGFFWM